MRVLKKMSFDALVENISKEDKKNILGGSGSSNYGVTNGSYYDANSSMIANSLKQTLGTVSSSYTGLNSTNIQGSSMYTYQQGYLDPGGMGYNSASNYQYYYSNSNTQQKPPMDCVFQCLGWISYMLGDTTHDAKFYEKMYSFSDPNLGTNALYNFLTGSGGGVPLNQVVNFVNKFFNATDYSGASNQFLAKFVNPSTNPYGSNQLMGIYRNETTGGLHSIMITKIEGNRVYFFDPQIGNSSSINRSDMKLIVGITGG